MGVNGKLTEELHTPAIKKFRRKKVYARFKDNILTEKFETNPRAPKFKVNDRVRLLSTRIFLLKVTLKTSQEKYLLMILC